LEQAAAPRSLTEMQANTTDVLMAAAEPNSVSQTANTSTMRMNGWRRIGIVAADCFH